MRNGLAIFWFRRDLRLDDNAGLYHALKKSDSVLPLFIFDTHILDNLKDSTDRRVHFIHQETALLKRSLNDMGSDLLTRHGEPLSVWKKLVTEYHVKHVYANHDYEPYAIKRDDEVKRLLKEYGIGFSTYKDQCIFEKQEILKSDGTPYTVFTPFSKKWKETLKPFYLRAYPTETYFGSFYKTGPSPVISLETLGFTSVPHNFPPKETTTGIIRTYDQTRDYPSLDTTRLSVHFRFGTVSVREKLRKALPLNEKWVNELIWRDFYMYILAHFPHVAERAFKPAYDRILWRNDEGEFMAWMKGMTGYPLVDAGMRELNATGFMHNRVRMVCASFLCKHLLVDWRWGEAYFAEKLLDFEMASNNGGWQWASGSGVDAAPYFRIFNPAIQLKKFDKDLHYVRKWVPEYGTSEYPAPVVDHEFARKRCLDTYRKVLNG